VIRVAAKPFASRTTVPRGATGVVCSLLHGTFMARPLRLHVPGALFHVISRGNAKQVIFVGSQDYEHFLALLARVTVRFSVHCNAYCLMPNHFHLMLAPTALPLSRMMQQLNSAYGSGSTVGTDAWATCSKAASRPCSWTGTRTSCSCSATSSSTPSALGPWTNPQLGRGVAIEPWPGWSRLVPHAGLGWQQFDRPIATGPETIRRLCCGSGQRLQADRFACRWSEGILCGASAQMEQHRSDPDIVYREKHARRPGLEQVLCTSEDQVRQDAAVREAFEVHGYTLGRSGPS